VLAACAPTLDTAVAEDDGFLTELPEAVLAVVAPHQNLRAVQIMPEDGCYWYRHRGPVETTMLPLLTTAGRHICTRVQTGPFAAG
jgi:hypothetical protein